MLPALLLAAALPGEAPSHHIYAGRCEYADAVVARRADTVLALCNELAMDQQGSAVTFDFRNRDGNAGVRFAGELKGHRLRVTRLAAPGRDFAPATGSCQIFFANDRPSVVACLATAGVRPFAANFRLSDEAREEAGPGRWPRR